jgi:hypothetical protein
LAGVNTFDGYTPSVPHGETLDLGSDAFMELEDAGGTCGAWGVGRGAACMPLLQLPGTRSNDNNNH